jgi:hypothetical protein
LPDAGIVEIASAPGIPNGSFIQRTIEERYSMGEISELLQSKAGLSPDKAQEVEQLVVEYAQSKVPAEFQGMLGSVLGLNSAEGQPAQSGGLGSLLGAASSLFGSKG